MTEPNEPKIVHFSPRAQAPVQDTAGNWEPDEQLFGLEELQQQLPPIRKLHLEKGRLTDLVRLYPDMKRTFDAPELLPEAVIASAMVRRRMELLLFRADDRREAGYALVTVCSPYGYVLVHALTIYPYLRGQLLGRVAMELIARCYAGKKGILYCQSRTCVALPERERQVIALRFYHGMTQQNCAKVMHVSQVQISRLERRAVELLREKLE